MPDADKEAVKLGLILELLVEPGQSRCGDCLLNHFTPWHPRVCPPLASVGAATPYYSSDGFGERRATWSLRAQNALVALGNVYKRYEFEPRDQRGPLHQRVPTSFPWLLSLAQQFSVENQYSLEAALCKTNYSKSFGRRRSFS